MLRVLSDILTALDSGNLAMLSLLDLSAAFDSVGRKILLHRLQTYYGLGGVDISWFISYLTGRTQCVRQRFCMECHRVRLGTNTFPAAHR